MRKALGLLALIPLFVVGLLLGQQTGNGLPEAMESLEKMVAVFAASDRKGAANALLDLGRIAETLGQSSRARGYYERIRNDFKDQTAAVEAATSRLNAPLGTRSAASPSTVTIRTPYSDDLYGFALSPDGKTLVFQVTTSDGKRQIWRQTVDASAKPEPIAGTDGAGANARPFFSPDGKSIVFFAKQKIWQVDLAGGVPKALIDASFFYGGSWSGDNILLGIHTNSPLDLLKDGRLNPRSMKAGVFFASPQFLDDRRFLYFARDPQTQGVFEVAALDGTVVPARGLPRAVWGAYTTGFLVYVTPTGGLNAVKFDPKGLVTAGSPFALAAHVGTELRLVGWAPATVSSGGSVAYRESAVMDKQMLWMDRNGALLGTLGAPDSASPGLPRVSPDGQTVLFFRQTGAVLGSIWAMNTQTGASSMFQGTSNVAIWSPAGDKVIVTTLRNLGGGGPAGPYLLERPVTGSAGGRQFGPNTGTVLPQDSTKDGAVLYLTGISPIGTGTGDLFLLPPNSETPIPVAQTPASERNGRFSPDGKWITYQSDEGGRDEVYVQPFPGTVAERQRVSLNGGGSPQWGRDGRELYFIAGDNRLMVVEAVPGAGKGALQLSTPKPLFGSPLPPGSEYDTVANGDRFLILAPVGDPAPIVVSNNWMPGN